MVGSQTLLLDVCGALVRKNKHLNLVIKLALAFPLPLMSLCTKKSVRTVKNNSEKS